MLRKIKILPFLLLTILLCVPSTHSAAQESRPLIVGISECVPFVIREKNGTYGGLALELLKRVGAEMEITYEIKSYPWNGYLEALKKGEIDLGVSCTGITSEREQDMDFSYPYYETSLTAAVGQADAFQAVRGVLLSWNALAAILSLVILSGIVGWTTWAIEHKTNTDVFPLDGRVGKFVDIYLSGVVFIFGGGLDYTYYKTMGGRVIAVVGRVANTIFITGLIAIVVSSVTSALINGQINDPNDLNNAHVGALPETVAETYLIQNNIGFTAFRTNEELLDALEKSQVNAAMDDEPILAYIIKKGNEVGKYSDLVVLPWRLEQVMFGFAMPNGSPLREPLNLALLKVLEDPDWKDYEDSYFKN